VLPPNTVAQVRTHDDRGETVTEYAILHQYA